MRSELHSVQNNRNRNIWDKSQRAFHTKRKIVFNDKKPYALITDSYCPKTIISVSWRLCLEVRIRKQIVSFLLKLWRLKRPVYAFLQSSAILSCDLFRWRFMACWLWGQVFWAVHKDRSCNIVLLLAFLPFYFCYPFCSFILMSHHRYEILCLEVKLTNLRAQSKTAVRNALDMKQSTRRYNLRIDVLLC